ncbi:MULTISPECIES: sodium/bile acid symporter family protein [Flavobacteriaceae]|jgi:ACR3 family arsenite efflux pump ArsB|uniref:Bile acid:sodium symporter n=2 Tax=Flavobacteriaceae TaxID=49546 RepID=A0A0Q9Z6Z7_9FLAO|nr:MULTISPECIES: sodium/bile acid symporter family protein [Flavobacteriaceae]MAC64178.1 hypothetical protein [Flavobacteriaceae bacterium]MAS72843.1 hypothetical protein [Zunongwangia sp.]ADF54347.1 sodium/bile acid symporter family protein [Zunongwangia profunda SM-A87]APS38534.1 hypothetical protein AO058_06360 [Salegentibacter sp. T436]KRG27657.1 hypothetical protein APR42_11360 [Salegentibacter mishustinae]|tara:strand:- start:6338 stop:6625 length:288 start_codon:yes stop_codon:yes gene_type:complete
MEKINKYQTGVILLAVVLGLLLGNLAILERYASSFIVLLLMVMLYGLFLSINIGELKSAFFNLKFSVSSLVINFIWTPLFAYLLGYLFLDNELAI